MNNAPPHSIEAEQSVLGGAMLGAAWDELHDKLEEADFYRADHRLIFQAVQQLHHAGKPIDFLTVSGHLETLGKLEDAGGLAYIAELAKNTPSAANINAYADVIRERAILRALLAASYSIGERCLHTEGADTEQLLNMAEQEILAITNRKERNKGEPKPLREVISKALDYIEANASHQGLSGLSTGLIELDGITGGLQEQDLIVLAARPSMGKTTLMMNICEHAALVAQRPVIVFSMEMGLTAIGVRLISSSGAIAHHHLRSGQLNQAEWDRLTEAARKLSQYPFIYVDESPMLTPQDIRSRTRRIAVKHGQPALIALDYIQLMASSTKTENRVQEVSQITRDLKALAKEMNCPVLALSQLNRSLESRADKRPMLSDLRESGAIEQDADLILFVYRDEVYNTTPSNKGVAELLVAKQRNGPVGKVHVMFDGQYSRFRDMRRQ